MMSLFQVKLSCPVSSKQLDDITGIETCHVFLLLFHTFALRSSIGWDFFSVHERKVMKEDAFCILQKNAVGLSPQIGATIYSVNETEKKKSYVCAAPHLLSLFVFLCVFVCMTHATFGFG